MRPIVFTTAILCVAIAFSFPGTSTMQLATTAEAMTADEFAALPEIRSAKLIEQELLGQPDQSVTREFHRYRAEAAARGADPSFAANLTDGGAYVYSLAVQDDGKVLAGGTFQSVDGVRRGHLERFAPDGTPDLTFNPGGAGANGQVYVIIVLPNGKIMIAGFFTSYNGENAQKIARLNSDGTLDTTFTVQGTSVNSGIQDLVFQPDGKTLISGAFTSFNGVVRNRVARLNPDGTLDTAFNPNVNGFVEEIVLQPDGKIFIGGVFSTVGGLGRSSIARLNPDGTLDMSFEYAGGVLSGPSAVGSVYAAELQPDGKILIGGVFDVVNGEPRYNVARLHPNGVLDGTFAPNPGSLGVEFFALQPDGKIIGVGQFFAFGSKGVVRWNTNGTVDTTFLREDIDDFGYVVTLQPDGKVVVGGLFSRYGNSNQAALVRLNSNGSVDSFAPTVTADPIVWALEQQPDGKILVGGQFRKANGQPRLNIARFHLDGTLDATFEPGDNFGGLNRPYVYSLRAQADGKILVGGNFSREMGSLRDWIMRVNSDGSIDHSFFYYEAISIVRDIEVQPDGKIWLAGLFQSAFPQFVTGIVRLNSNGTYNIPISGAASNSAVQDVKLLPDGRVLLAGFFTTYNGVLRNRIARILANGSLDPTFDPGTGANGSVLDVEVLENGQIYAGGAFTSFNGLTGTNDVVRLFPNGAVDTSFSTGESGFNGNVNALEIEPGDNLLVGGNFNAYNGTPVNRLARLNSDGSRDTAFDSPLDDTSTTVQRILRQADGRILVGGTFFVPRAGVFRLRTGGSVPFDFDADGRSDISVFRPTDGNWYLQRSTDGFFGMTFGVGSDRIVPADYDGDGKTDVAVYRPSTGIWYVVNSSDGTFSYHAFGIEEDLPAPADYDGDGKADVTVFRPSTGTWYRQNSSDGSYTIVQFGTNGDQPTIGDFDGDGKADIAVFRPSNGAWYQLNSSDGSFFGEQFGIATDKITPADYDGDGKTDIAIYRPSEGLWYYKNSATPGTYTPYVFGLAEDIPVPGDYDGDGKADIAVFRPSNGHWYIANSSNGSFTIFPWGQNGDRPTPNAFGN